MEEEVRQRERAFVPARKQTAQGLHRRMELVDGLEPPTG